MRAGCWRQKRRFGPPRGSICWMARVRGVSGCLASWHVLRILSRMVRHAAALLCSVFFFFSFFFSFFSCHDVRVTESWHCRMWWCDVVVWGGVWPCCVVFVVVAPVAVLVLLLLVVLLLLLCCYGAQWSWCVVMP